jgi:hypothetical protein
VVMERKAAGGIPACGQAPSGRPATVALHEAVPRAEGSAWAAAVCAAGAEADITNRRDESPKAQLDLVHVRQNGERDDVV